MRHDSRGAVVIGQPSHAWISGQLARSWGNERFGAVEPFEEVCLAAEQHDIGMAMWDLEPARNPESGLPASFLQMEIRDHIELWTLAPRRLLRQSRYAALLVSLHGTRLYAHRDVSAFLGPERSLVLEFLEGQRRLQHELIETLRADPKTAATRELRDSRAQQPPDRRVGHAVAGALPRLRPLHRQPRCRPRAVLGPSSHYRKPTSRGGSSLDPWPFHTDSLVVHCEGQRLVETYTDDAAMHTALARAPWETLEFELVPA